MSRRRRERGPKVRCTKCLGEYSLVIGSGLAHVKDPHDPHAYIRQRMCDACGHAWHTSERNLEESISSSDTA